MTPQQLREDLGPVFDAVFGRFDGFREVQLKAIPIVLGGAGALVVAPTASGKTEALLAPVLRRAQHDPDSRPYALWLCPTRALVNDAYARMTAAVRRLELDVAIRTGERKSKVGDKTAILVTTPESLDVMLSSSDLSKQLAGVRMVVVDEAHLLYGTGRGQQVLFLFERLERVCGARTQRCGLSATIGRPDDVATWLQGDGPALEVVHAAQQREIDLTMFSGGSDARKRTTELVTKGLRGHDYRKILLFSNSRNEASELAARLSETLDGFSVHLHYSSLPKSARERVEKQFREGDRGVCVATSTLELGIDIGDVDAVYLYGAPGSISSFLQRAGRGNRRSNTTRVLAVPRTHDARQSPRPDLWQRDVLTFLGTDRATKVGRLEQPHAPHYWSVLVQQTFSLARRLGQAGARPLVTIAGRSVAPYVSPDGCRLLLEHLEGLGYLRHIAYGDYYALDDKGWEWLESLQIWSNFSDQSESTPIVQDRDVLEQVAWVNRLMLKPGSLVLVKGSVREVLEIAPREIRVGSPTRSGAPMRLKRLGQGWPVSFEIAQSLGELTRDPEAHDAKVEPALEDWTKQWLGRFSALDLSSQLAVEPGTHECHTFAGGLGNQLVAELLRKDGEESAPTDLTVRRTRTDRMPAALQHIEDELESLAPAMAPLVPTSVHYEMLEPSLQADEIASIVGQPELLAHLRCLPSMEMTELSPPPPVPT